MEGPTCSCDGKRAHSLAIAPLNLHTNALSFSPVSPTSNITVGEGAREPRTNLCWPSPCRQKPSGGLWNFCLCCVLVLSPNEALF